MEYIVDHLSEYLEFIHNGNLPKEDVEKDKEDIIISHFRSVNLSNEFTIKRLPMIMSSPYIIKGYSLEYNGTDPKKGITVAQLHNMNLTSGYKSTICPDGSYIVNIFFLNKCINLITEGINSYKDEDIHRMLINLKLISTHLLREFHPSFDERYANVAGGVIAVATTRRIGLPVTPILLSEAYHCTTALAETIIDRYDAIEHKFTDTPWMI